MPRKLAFILYDFACPCCGHVFTAKAEYDPPSAVPEHRLRGPAKAPGPVDRWISEQVVTVPGAFATSRDLLSAYNRWAEVNGCQAAPSPRWVSEALSARGYQLGRRKGSRGAHRVRILPLVHHGVTEDVPLTPDGRFPNLL